MKRLSQTNQGTNKIINVVDPTSAQDAATKAYVDQKAIKIVTSGTRPGSPIEGDVIYETDTDMTWTYDGTNWLGPPYDLPFATYIDLNPQATGTRYPAIAATPGDYNLKILRWSMSMYQSTVGSGTNYWTINLKKTLSSGAADVLMATGNTQTIPAATWTTLIETTSFTGSPTTHDTNPSIYLECVSTGAPNLTFFTTNMRVRLVG